MAIIKKIVLADEQIQMDADMVDAAQPLLNYMMQKSIGYISKQEKVSNSNSTNRQQHHTKPMSKKLLKQFIKPLMDIYLKEIPTEAQRLFKSANKMVALNNGVKSMNATTSGATDGRLKDGYCHPYYTQCYDNFPYYCGDDYCNCAWCFLSFPLEHSWCC